MAYTYADVAWLAEDDELGDLWCLTFVRGVGEVEALLRLGADQNSIRPLTHDELLDDGLSPETVLAGRGGRRADHLLQPQDPGMAARKRS